MAVYNDYDFGGEPDGGGLQNALNWAGAFLSILLLAGLATWGWKLWVRDVSGVPVVRALEGPMRTVPADPGGLATEYQGLSVNRIAEDRSADEMADRVILAPQPSTLNEDEDLAMAELVPLPQTAPIAAPVETDPMADAGDGLSIDRVLSQAIEGAQPFSVTDAPIVEEESEPLPVESGETTEIVVVEEDVAPAMSATDLAVAAALGVLTEAPEATVRIASQVPASTPRPAIRPEKIERVSTPAFDEATGEIEASTIPAGTRLVQLGAYGSAEVARAEWDRSIARFGDYMVGKERVVQQAQSGGRTFWRLRAMGFEGLSDARRFCAVLVADGANCIPVVQE